MSPNVRTTLIHRCQRGAQPWWRNPVVYEFLGMLDNEGVTAATDVLPRIAELGVQGVLIRPAWVDHERHADLIGAFIERAHDLKLRAIIRISGASRSVTGKREGDVFPFVGYEASTEGVLRRAELFLDMGADGIDLGMFVESAMVPEDSTVSSRRLTQLIEQLRELIASRELGPDLIAGPKERVGDTALERITIGGASSTTLPELLRKRLAEDLLHTLRDDTLVRVPFAAEEIRERIAEIVTTRDQNGVLLAWYCSPAFVRTRAHNPAGRVGWYSVHADEATKRARSQAMDLLLLGLPGAVYLHGGDEVALVDETLPIDESNPRASEAERIRHIDRMAAESFEDPESAWRIHRRALRVRRDYNLNGGSLAWIDDGVWDTDKVLALMSGQLLLLLNTSDEAIELTDEWRPLVSSHYVHHHRSRGTYSVPAGACAWFEQLPVEIPDPGQPHQ